MSMREIIVRNSARCLLCGDEIESTHRHDFRTCRCGNFSVDGGRDYLRRLADSEGSWIDTSIQVELTQLEQAALFDERHPPTIVWHEVCIAVLQRADISAEARAFLIQRHLDGIAAIKSKESE